MWCTYTETIHRGVPMLNKWSPDMNIWTVPDRGSTSKSWKAFDVRVDQINEIRMIMMTYVLALIALSWTLEMEVQKQMRTRCESFRTFALKLRKAEFSFSRLSPTTQFSEFRWSPMQRPPTIPHSISGHTLFYIGSSHSLVYRVSFTVVCNGK